MAAPKAHAVFEILVREHTDRLMAYLRAITLDASAADDLFQETMLRAWRRLDTYDHSRPFGPWLRGIARRVALEVARDRLLIADEATLDAVERHADRFDGPQGSDFRERLATLQACVQALAEPYATTIDLVYRGGQPLERVAEQASENLETVKKRVQRARSMIAECLHRKGAFA